MFPPTMEMLLNIEQFSSPKIHLNQNHYEVSKWFFLFLFVLGITKAENHLNKYPPVYNGGISRGQKWWKNILEHMGGATQGCFK